MAQTVRVWFDTEGDFLEVRFTEEPAYMRETDNDAVMQKRSSPTPNSCSVFVTTRKVTP